VLDSPQVSQDQAVAVVDDGIMVSQSVLATNACPIANRRICRHARARVAGRLAGRAAHLRDYARRERLAAHAHVESEPALLRSETLTQCAYCAGVIDIGSPVVTVGGSLLHDSPARPCFADFDADLREWDRERLLADRRPTTRIA
jgi:hypothetical protein